MVHPEVASKIAAEEVRLRKLHPNLSEEYIQDMAYNYVQACCMADTELFKEVYHVSLTAKQ